jgi:dTDP-4-dehydrorhamnose reductase
VAQVLGALRGGGRFAAPDDLTLTPTYIPDLVNVALDLLIDGACGVWHLSGPDPVTWAEFARAAAARAGYPADCVESRPASALGWVAPRPAYSALGTTRGTPLPPLADALDRCFHELGAAA